MTTIVVGGHSRNVGKTSIVAGLIGAFPRYPWTAAKISSHWHTGSSPSGDEEREDICNIYEEIDREGSADTSRFLAAGALHSLWVRVRESRFEAAMQRLLPVLRSNPFLIIESNSIVRFIQPNLSIMVLRFDVEEFKESAREMLSQADAVVAVNYRPSPLVWQGISRESLARIPLFSTTNPQIIPEELIDFVQAKLNLSPGLAPGDI